MDEWLNIVVTLSITGSSIFILSYGITTLSSEVLTAKWYYWNRKLALFFFLVPVFLILSVPLLLEKEQDFLSFQQLPIVEQNTMSLSEIFVHCICDLVNWRC
ncbi:hypothetical protein ACVNNN_06980 [Lysinibacillus fusiformis]|uniref:hypothetical protein n=1 Tax=Lysinibacillus sp. PWR01 TaxID=3342384 RepID=UPI00372D1DBA